MTGYKFFALDTETTGLNPEHDAIIEIAVVEVGNRNETFSTFVKPVGGLAINPGAFYVHGISDAELHHPQVPTLSIVWQQICRFISDRTPNNEIPVLVAHNGFAFHFKMLIHNLFKTAQAAGYSTTAIPDECLELMHRMLLLDTLELCQLFCFQDLANGPHGRRLRDLKLATVASYFRDSLDEDPIVCNRASDDADLLAQMLPALLDWITEIDEWVMEHCPMKMADYIIARVPEVM